MNGPSDRPDPDALLRRVTEDEARARRGKLKVFFGFAPGVGKTYRMLQVARDLVYDQHADVVVGLIETHGRSETAALILGLELLPRRTVEYRGRTLEEFDLDAALARKPKLLLLDELAHTNAPGSRHAKRWKDVQELVEAGIDVFTTMNVQHVESLNDVVAQITHVQVRETVPDSVLDGADETELVDIAPEELLQRLREGKVYLPEQALRAADHFFKRGNLLALRELALRRVAQTVDEDVREYREEHGVVSTWPAGERVMVCVGPAPNSGRLIRAAARMAAGLRSPWVAAYVGATALEGMSEQDRERLESHLRLAESLGASVARLGGGRISEAILGYARRQNVTRILLGKPTHSWLRDRLRGSLLDEVVRGSGEIDVLVIGAAERELQEARRGRVAPPFRVAPYAFALALVALTTALAAGVRTIFPVPDLSVLYMVAVMVAAIRHGRRSSILAAAVSVAAYDFFFVPPYLTFAVADARYFLTFAMMFGVGWVVGELTTRLRRQEQDANLREERTSALYALSRELGAADRLERIAEVVARQAAEVFGAAAVVLGGDEADGLRLLASFPPGGLLEPNEAGVTRWSFEHGQIAGLGTDTLPGSSILCAPLWVAGAPVGVVALQPKSSAPLRVEQREFLEAFCRQAAVAMDRVRLADEARKADLRAESEQLRSSLLSTVSHDLRTPLASITGAATSLRDDPRLDESTRRELLQSICEETDRLERLVGNLLDMTRLEAGGLALRREWVPVIEVIGSALTRLEGVLGDRPVRTELPNDLPLISVDPVVFEQLFVNLFENAAKYTPAGSPIDVHARVEDGSVVVEVLDRGPGLPPGTLDRVFEKFYRGAHAGISGAGLGLAICRGIAEAHGGSISAANRPGGGAIFRVAIRSAGDAPTVARDAEDGP